MKANEIPVLSREVNNTQIGYMTDRKGEHIVLAEWLFLKLQNVLMEGFGDP